MGNNTGTILEIKGNKAIVMTNTCDFIAITRMPEMFVGQQVDLNNSAIKSKSNPLKYFAIAGMFVLILCSVLIYQLVKPSAVFAYVDVDINPSLELLIDKKANVIEVKTLNSDADALVKDIRLVNKSLTNAVKIIIKESQNKGFIRPDTKNAVLISASINPGKSISSAVSSEKILDVIVSDLQKTDFSIGAVSIKAEVVKVDPIERSEAVKNNISMGRYKLFEEITESDENIDIEKAKTEGLSKIIEEYETKEQEKTIASVDKDNSYKPVQDNKEILDKPKNSTAKDNPKIADNKKPENNNSQKYSNGNSNSSKNSAVKPNKAEDQFKASRSNSENNSSNNRDQSKNTNKKSSDEKKTLDQGSKPVTTDDGTKSLNNKNNNKNKNNDEKPKNHPAKENKQENGNNNQQKSKEKNKK